MIYRANKDTKQICLQLRRNKMRICGGDISLRITPLVCNERPEYIYCRTPCGGVERIEKEREPTLTLVYDMFDFNTDGGICFLLDEDFALLECGRYKAEIVMDKCVVYTFQIDKRETVGIAQITMSDSNDCCEGKYGC